jgi:hypothetical protein
VDGLVGGGGGSAGAARGDTVVRLSDRQSRTGDGERTVELARDGDGVGPTGRDEANGRRFGDATVRPYRWRARGCSTVVVVVGGGRWG